MPGFWYWRRLRSVSPSPSAGQPAWTIRARPTASGHGLAEIRFRMLMIAAGYEDANDCDALRADPAFKMAVGRLPESGDLLLAADHVPAREPARQDRARPHDGRHGRASTATAFVRSCGASSSISTTRWIVHGHQQLSLFHAHHDHRRFRQSTVYDVGSGKPVAVILRLGKTPNGAEVLRSSVTSSAPSAAAGRRSTSPFAATAITPGTRPRPWCERNRVGYIFGLAGNKVLLRQVAALAEDAAMARIEGESRKRSAATTLSSMPPEAGDGVECQVIT
ncbi:MAG: transposase [Alphaproteobacteria bacterium]